MAHLLPACLLPPPCPHVWHRQSTHSAPSPHRTPPLGGFFKETYRSGAVAGACKGLTDTAGTLMDTDRGGPRNVLTSIYYMLTKAAPVGYWHMNKSTIVHYFQASMQERFDQPGKAGRHGDPLPPINFTHPSIHKDRWHAYPPSPLSLSLSHPHHNDRAARP